MYFLAGVAQNGTIVPVARTFVFPQKRDGWIVLGSFDSLTRMLLFWSCLMLSDADKEPVDTKAEAKEEEGLEGGGMAHSAVMLLVFGLPVQVGIEECQLARSLTTQATMHPTIMDAFHRSCSLTWDMRKGDRETCRGGCGTASKGAAAEESRQKCVLQR